MTNYSQLLTLLEFLNICGSSKPKEEATKLSNVVVRDRVKKNLDYLVTSIKRVGRYLAEITIS